MIRDEEAEFLDELCETYPFLVDRQAAITYVMHQSPLFKSWQSTGELLTPDEMDSYASTPSEPVTPTPAPPPVEKVTKAKKSKPTNDGESTFTSLI